MRKSAASYLLEQFREFGHFASDWGALSDKDKKELRQYAEDEMDVLGLIT